MTELETQDVTSVFDTTEIKIQRIFDLKGVISPLAEKANKNFKLRNNPKNVYFKKHLHHYTIGHALKGIDKKIVFQYKQDNVSFKQIPQRYKKLHHDYFNADYFSLVNSIRNIYGHYIHHFDKLNIAEKQDTKEFLEESFEVAVLLTYLKATNKKLEDVFKIETHYNKITDLDKKLVFFLQEMFYPYFKGKKDAKLTQEEESRKKKMNAKANAFKNFTLKQAIQEILFIEVTEPYQYVLEDAHTSYPVFTIEKGLYLSRYGHMFLLSMFLYRNESEMLLSNINGFKRNDTEKFRNKRNLFSFYSKKFSSQDINSEEGNLIKYRDILQYLNKYPVAWNKSMENFYLTPNSDDALYHKAKALEESFFRNEFEKLYPDEKENEAFYNYFKDYILADEKYREKKEKNYVKDKMNQVEIDYFNLLYFHPKVAKYKKEIAQKVETIKYNKNAQAFNIYVISEVVKKYFPEKREDYKIFIDHQYKEEDNLDKLVLQYKINPKIKTLVNRIEQKTLWKSYGRNQDRFMEFCLRFLAEKNYFGEHAQFKSYVTYGAKEQQEALDKEYERLKDDKKASGKIKFHKGKFVTFQKFEDITKNFPVDYCPFVIENNAFQVKTEDQYFSIQRNLLPYLLQHAICQEGAIKGGYNLFRAYFSEQNREFETLQKAYNDTDVLTAEEKTKMMKFFPKGIVHQKAPAQRQLENMPCENPFRAILNKALLAENRYEELKKQAQDLDREDDFLKKNKGKQFKLYFIKKAWNLMFFKEKYAEKVTINKGEHHTSYHISRTEFNDFSKYLHGLEEIEEYKGKLLLLLTQKDFLDAEGFLRNIISSSKSIHEIYKATKAHFEDWITEAPQTKSKTYSLDSFVEKRKGKGDLDNPHIVYINASHFIDFLLTKKVITASSIQDNTNRKIMYPLLDQYKKHLLEVYYPEFNKEEQKAQRTIYKKIHTARLEDACLYAIAQNYLSENLFDEKLKGETNKNNISVVLNQVYKQGELCTDYTVRDILQLDFRFKVEEKTNEQPTGNAMQSYYIELPFQKIDLISSWMSSNSKEEDHERSSVFLKDLAIYLEQRYIDFNYNEILYGKKDIKKRKSNTGIWDEIYDFKHNRLITWNGIAKVYNHIIPLALQFTKVYMQLEKYYLIKNLQSGKTYDLKDNKVDIVDIEGLREYFDYNATTNKVDDLKRHEAFHLNFPKGKTFAKRLLELEKEFFEKEINYSPTNWDAIQSEHKEILIAFLNTIHTDLYNQKEKNVAVKIADANQKYFNQVLNKKQQKRW